MADLTTLSRAEALEAYERTRRTMARVRAEAEEQGESIAMSVLEVTAGGLFGVAEEHFGQRAIMGFNVPMVVGGVSAAAAIFGVGGRGTMNAGLRAIGNAGLVIESYKKTMTMYRDYRIASEAGGGQQQAA